jgi:hypothetical protein
MIWITCPAIERCLTNVKLYLQHDQVGGVATTRLQIEGKPRPDMPLPGVGHSCQAAHAMEALTSTFQVTGISYTGGGWDPDANKWKPNDGANVIFTLRRI